MESILQITILPGGEHYSLKTEEDWPISLNNLLQHFLGLDLASGAIAIVGTDCQSLAAMIALVLAERYRIVAVKEPTHDCYVIVSIKDQTTFAVGSVLW